MVFEKVINWFRDDIYRSLFYGLSASLGSMIESMQETMEEPSEVTVVPPFEEVKLVIFYI